MEILIQPLVKSGRENDCWCHAMSLATNRSYEDVYKEFTPFIEEDGGIREPFVDGYLAMHGFKQFTFRSEHDMMTVNDCIASYNTHDNLVVLRVDIEEQEESHVVFVHKNVMHDDFDDKEVVEAFMECKVRDVLMKTLD